LQEFEEFRSCRSSEFAWLGPKDATLPEKYWGSGVTEYCFVLSCGIWLILELLELLNSSLRLYQLARLYNRDMRSCR
jgi:hypothetical protein